MEAATSPAPEANPDMPNQIIDALMGLRRPCRRGANAPVGGLDRDAGSARLSGYQAPASQRWSATCSRLENYTTCKETEAAVGRRLSVGALPPTPVCGSDRAYGWASMSAAAKVRHVDDTLIYPPPAGLINSRNSASALSARASVSASGSSSCGSGPTIAGTSWRLGCAFATRRRLGGGA